MDGLLVLRRTGWVLLGWMAIAAPLRAGSGTEGASFLDIPVGAAPAALGSAYVALAADAFAPVYNPAGLGFLKGPELAAQHLAYVQAIRHDFFSAVIPLGSQASRGLGFSIQDVGTGDVARTDVSNGQPVTGLGSFSSHWAAYNLAYGQTLTERWSLGVTGKIIHATLDDVSATAYAADAGTLFQWDEHLSFAAAAVNLGQTFTFLQQHDPLPLAFHGGAAYRANTHWGFSAEGVYRKTGLASAHAGAEWHPADIVSLRAGYKTDTLKGLNALAGFTAGVGIHLWGHELAYAWVPYGELGDAQYVSLQMRFGAANQRRNLINAPRQAHQPHIQDVSMAFEEMER